MSYEGYEQLICENGHYWVIGCHDFVDDARCPQCNAKVKHWNSVDVTNGSYCDCIDGKCGFCNNGRIDGYKEPVVIEKPKYCICDKCGNKHVTEPAIYGGFKDK